MTRLGMDGFVGQLASVRPRLEVLLVGARLRVSGARERCRHLCPSPPPRGGPPLRPGLLSRSEDHPADAFVLHLHLAGDRPSARDPSRGPRTIPATRTPRPVAPLLGPPPRRPGRVGTDRPRGQKCDTRPARGWTTRTHDSEEHGLTFVRLRYTRVAFDDTGGSLGTLCRDERLGGGGRRLRWGDTAEHL